MISGVPIKCGSWVLVLKNSIRLSIRIKYFHILHDRQLIQACITPLIAVTYINMLGRQSCMITFVYLCVRGFDIFSELLGIEQRRG